MRDAEQHPNPACPRCGYDLDGAVAVWNGEGVRDGAGGANATSDSACCPLQGTCSECGRSFWWADVLREDRAGPAWSFEHTPKKAGLASNMRRLDRTLARLLRGRRLWGSMPLTAPVRIGRAMIIGLAGLFAGYTVCIVAVMSMMLIGWILSRLPTTSGTVPRPILPSKLLWDFRSNWFVHWFARGGQSPNFIGWLWALLIGPCMLLFPSTLRRAGVGWRHVVRVWLYGLWLVPPVGLAMSARMFVMGSYSWASGNGVDKGSIPYRIACASGFIGLAGVFLLIWLWWSAAAERYMHLPRARLTTFVLLVVSLWISALVCEIVPAVHGSTRLYLRSLMDDLALID